MPDPAPSRSKLTPDLALAYLASLWPALRAAAVLGADGAPQAGDARAGARGRALLDAAGRDEAWSVDGLFAARSPGHVVTLDAGPGALRAVVRLDLRLVLEALGSA
jgi:hypothetical protein